jgi:hypothetical protein
MKEVTQRSPLMGVLLSAGLPFYTAFKLVGVPLGGTGEMKTSQPSMDEIFAGWTGFKEGL